MAVRVGINGFGRIGRILYRAGSQDLEVVGINNTGELDAAAHLLKYDSTHGKLPYEVKTSDNQLIVNGKAIHYSCERDPAEIPWKDWGVDVVLECTGAFKKREDFAKHLTGGAKKVLVSAPAPGADLTVVYGINHEQYNPSQHEIISNASCTTNCLAPLAKVLDHAFGIEQGFMTTIHSYTNDQRLLDNAHSDLRRARAATLSMIPTTTGAAIAVGEVLPQLKGRIDGVSIRVPTPDVSLVDFVIQTRKPVSKESINESLIGAANGSLKGVLRCENDPLVSADFIGDMYSSIVDLPSTMVVGSHMAKVFAWYDNEMGFSRRMVDMVKYVESKGL